MKRAPNSVNPLDLATLTKVLEEEFGNTHFRSYLRGKTDFRDALIKYANVSMEEAERLVDTLELRNFLSHERGSKAKRLKATWQIHGVKQTSDAKKIVVKL